MENTTSLPLNLSFPQLIKILHLVAWTLLFCAGALLCHRVASNPTAGESLASAASAPDQEEDASLTDVASTDLAQAGETKQADRPKNRDASNAPIAEKAGEKPEKRQRRKPPKRLTPKNTGEKQAKPEQVVENKSQKPATPSRKNKNDTAKNQNNGPVENKPSKEPSNLATIGDSEPTTKSLNVSQVKDLAEPTGSNTGLASSNQTSSDLASSDVASSDLANSSQSNANASQTKSSEPTSSKPVTEVAQATPEKAVTAKRPAKKKRPKKTSPKSPVPRLKPSKPVETNSITIANPLKIGYPVSFLVNAENVTLKPGEKFELDLTKKTAEKPEIRFDRGGDFGERREVLKPGSYEFQVTRQGWDVVKSKTD